MTDTTKVEWPKWLYRKGEGSEPEAVLFETADDVPAGNWKEHPRDCRDPLDHDGDDVRGGSTKTPEKDAVIAELEALDGVDFDRRWSLKRLQGALADARAAKAAS